MRSILKTKAVTQGIRTFENLHRILGIKPFRKDYVTSMIPESVVRGPYKTTNLIPKINHKALKKKLISGIGRKKMPSKRGIPQGVS
jgi:hypothetical protein